MPTIFTIGETIYDIIFEHSQPKAARPGGSMLNTAVSLGGCGLKVEMIMIPLITGQIPLICPIIYIFWTRPHFNVIK